MPGILIVDDISQNIYMLEVLFKGYGYEVTAAGNGREALDSARKNPPDLIISDILMPVMDGFELCRQLKKDSVLAPIPFVFYTATYTEEKDEAFALSLGADRYLLKPQPPDTLMQIVKELIEKRQLNPQAVPSKPSVEEAEVLQQYNEVLFRKLEKKVMQLEAEIANRKEIETKLAENEERYQTMADYAYDWEYWLAPDGSVIYMSPSCERVTGYSVENFIAHPDLIEEIIFPDDQELFNQHNDAVKINNSQSDFHEAVFRIIRREGEIRWISHNCRIIKRQNGSSLGLRATNRDITKRKQAEDALRKATQKYSSLYNSMMDSYILVDMDGKIVEINHMFKEMLGYSEAELYSLNYNDITPVKWHAFQAGILKEQVIVRGYSDVYEKEYIKKNGVVFPVELRTYLIRDDNGKPTGMWSIVRDITERKQAEKTLSESERTLRIVADNTYDWEFWIDPQGAFVYCSPSCF